MKVSAHFSGINVKSTVVGLYDSFILGIFYAIARFFSRMAVATISQKHG